MPLSKDAILSADDAKVETVSVPEWGGDVCVRGLKGFERDRFDQWGSEARDKKDLKSLDFSVDEMVSLSGKCAEPLNRVFEVCRRLSGLTQADEDDVEKN
jgi:hypothetical protein